MTIKDKEKLLRRGIKQNLSRSKDCLKTSKKRLKSSKSINKDHPTNIYEILASMRYLYLSFSYLINATDKMNLLDQ